MIMKLDGSAERDGDGLERWDWKVGEVGMDRDAGDGEWDVWCRVGGGE